MWKIYLYFNFKYGAKKAIQMCNHLVSSLVPFCESDDTVTSVARFAIATGVLSPSLQSYSEFLSVGLRLPTKAQPKNRQNAKEQQM